MIQPSELTVGQVSGIIAAAVVVSRSQCLRYQQAPQLTPASQIGDSEFASILISWNPEGE